MNSKRKTFDLKVFSHEHLSDERLKKITQRMAVMQTATFTVLDIEPPIS